MSPFSLMMTRMLFRQAYGMHSVAMILLNSLHSATTPNWYRVAAHSLAILHPFQCSLCLCLSDWACRALVGRHVLDLHSRILFVRDHHSSLLCSSDEVRKSNRISEHRLAQIIKPDSKRFHAYVRSKQNVRYKVGPLEDNAGKIITQGFLMAEELNIHFSSVFTREDTSSLPVPETKFIGPEWEMLG